MFSAIAEKNPGLFANSTVAAKVIEVCAMQLRPRLEMGSVDLEYLQEELLESPVRSILGTFDQLSTLVPSFFSQLVPFVIQSIGGVMEVMFTFLLVCGV